MFKSYLLTGFRNLYRNRLYALLNILGLGTAIALCVVAYLNYEFSQSFDQFHENLEDIYVINTYKVQHDVRREWSLLPMAVGPTLGSEVPGIRHFTRLSRTGGSLNYGDKIFHERILYADTTFFSMFSFDIIAGDKDPLKSQKNIVISEELAIKYFGDESPIGKTLLVRVEDATEAMTVGAVMDNPKSNSSIWTHVVIPFDNIQKLNGLDPQSWQRFTRATVVQLEPGVPISSLTPHLKRIQDLHNEANPNWQIAGIYPTPFVQVSRITTELGGSPFNENLHPAALISPSVIAFLVLLLACFNFINTSIAFSARRLKEIGVRKVCGSNRGRLILQFLTENLILCAIALVVGICLAIILVPAYDALWEELTISLSFTEDLGLWVFFAILLAATAILAGAYPAFYISSFQPTAIFRGNQKFGGTNPLIRVLLIFQFALAMLAIIFVIAMNQNSDFIASLDYGFDRDNRIIVGFDEPSDALIFQERVANHPDIVGTAGTHEEFGYGWATTNVEINGEYDQVTLYRVGPEYLDFMGVEMIEGRTFDKERSADNTESVIVTENFLKKYGWNSGVDKELFFSSSKERIPYNVIGVTKDVLVSGVWSATRPIIFRPIKGDGFHWLSVRYKENTAETVSTYLASEWQNLFPDQPYLFDHGEDQYAEAIKVNDTILLLCNFVAVVSLLIAFMGLFALVSLNVVRRSREIGIRKILGASFSHISYLLSKEFLLLLFAAAILSSIAGYFQTHLLISSIWEQYAPLGITPSFSAALIVTLGALLTVSIKVFRVSTANPVNAIRSVE